MKKLLLLVVCVLTISSIKAQDLIVLQTAEEIQAKVTAITEDTVTYKRWSNLEGPTYTIAKSKIFYIKYQNGEKDIFGTTTTQQSNKTLQTQEVLSTTTKQDTGNPIPIKFQGYTTLGTIFTADGAGPTLDLTFGAKIYDHFYIGIATGFHSCFTPYEYYYQVGFNVYRTSGTTFDAYIPIGVNMKGYFTKGRKVNPYINCSLGGFIGVSETLDGFNGFHCQVGAGIEVKRFTFGIGYNGLVKGGTVSCGYVQLGVRIGK